MARFDHLPVYKAAYELFRLIERLVRNMPKSAKPVLGLDLHRTCRKVIRQIWRANDARDLKKGRRIDRLIERVREIEVLLRLCQDERYISIPQYAEAVALSESVSKQAHGWRKRYASPAT